MALVVAFTATTLISVLSLQWTEYAVSSGDLVDGLRFKLPADLMIAMGAFGLTGVGGDEIMQYTYWLIEKGYAARTGPPSPGDAAWQRRARGWIKVMYVDALVSMVVYTVITAAFYLLGAAVLHARAETPVVSNNSAHRWTPDVPMMVPEINHDHAAVIDAQRRRLGSKRGFIAVKPNCSIQSYVPAIHPLKSFGPTKIAVATYQAVSGAGKTLESWPEMVDNVIPFIGGEEEKIEIEVRKILGSLAKDRVEFHDVKLSATTTRVPVQNGHTVSLSVALERAPEPDAIVNA